MVIAIKRFWPVQSPTLTELVFIWLAQFSQLIGTPTNMLNRIESERLFVDLSTNSNCTKSKSLLISPFINPDRTKSKSLSDNCCKKNSAKSKRVGNEQVDKDDSEGLD